MHNGYRAPQQFITASQACLKRREKSQTNSAPDGTRKRTKPKGSRKKEIIKIKAEICTIEI